MRMRRAHLDFFIRFLAARKTRLTNGSHKSLNKDGGTCQVSNYSFKCFFLCPLFFCGKHHNTHPPRERRCKQRFVDSDDEFPPIAEQSLIATWVCHYTEQVWACDRWVVSGSPLWQHTAVVWHTQLQSPAQYTESCVWYSSECISWLTS